MSHDPRKRYSAEFKREALRRANEKRVTDTPVAEEMEFSTRQLTLSRNKAKKHGDDEFPGYGNARDKKLMLLIRKFRKVEQDSSKEAAVYFCRRSPCSTPRATVATAVLG